MNRFVILTTRKRALIALVHSVVFLLIAVAALLSSKPAAGLLLQHATPVLITCGIYVVVTTVLFLLLRASICMKERLYFGFCTSSAALGLLRSVVGDPPFHAGQYLRVLFLAAAVFTGMVIVRSHDEAPLAD